VLVGKRVVVSIEGYRGTLVGSKLGDEVHRRVEGEGLQVAKKRRELRVAEGRRS
jgi:predicted polyphosphate/ATP-dependent NAD kinase